MSTTWMTTVVLLWLVVIALAFTVLGLLRRTVPLFEHIGRPTSGNDFGLAPGNTVSPFVVHEKGRGPLLSRDLFAVERTLLLFMKRDCSVCRQLVPELNALTDRLNGTAFAVVVKDTSDAEDLGLPSSTRVLFDLDDSARAAFFNRATPHAYLVDTGGVVLRRRITLGFDDLASLTVDLDGRPQTSERLTRI